MLFVTLYSPLETLLQFLANLISRRFEKQADVYATRLKYGNELKEGLLKLFLQNKADVDPDSMYSTYHYSHPTLMERLRTITDAMESKEE